MTCMPRLLLVGYSGALVKIVLIIQQVLPETLVDLDLVQRQNAGGNSMRSSGTKVVNPAISAGRHPG
jgi:hypothetical protein